MQFSEKKERLINSIKRKPLDRVPLMYRALPSVNKKLLSYFALSEDISISWQPLMEKLNIEAFSSGSGMGKFTSCRPKYCSAAFKINTLDSNMFYAWGIDSYIDIKSDSISYIDNAKTAIMSSIEDFKKMKQPEIDEFDLTSMAPDMALRKDHMLGTGVLNSIFMIAMYLRGAANLMMDLMIDKKLAHYYVDKVGQFACDLNKKILDKIGDKIDYYKLWDDMAMQNSLMISPEVFREYFYPWYKKLFSEAKKHNLITFFHICGNANEIIRDLIDIGVDVLDPVQTSALNMDLKHLKKEYGKHISFHGGVDVQGFLQNADPKEIIKYKEETEELFLNSGGLILGPAHEITSDTNIRNIVALYRPDLL